VLSPFCPRVWSLLLLFFLPRFSFVSS
jgi:hypothetical protein